MNRSIIIFPLLTWDSELIHRDQMLAKEFAKSEVQTYFLNRITRKPWKIFFNPSLELVDNVNVVSVFVLPYLQGRFSFIYKLNDLLIGRQLKNFYKGLSNSTIFYISNPDWATHVSKSIRNEDSVVYDISDDYTMLAKNAAWSKTVKDNDKLARKLAGHLIATNKALLKDDKGIQCRIITNGVDLNGFSTAKNAFEKNGYKKVAGFIGGIYEWVDLELISESSGAYPEVLFILIGPTNRILEIQKLVRGHQNVQYLGVVPKVEIANYFGSLDLGLMPFVSEKRYPRLVTVDSGKIYQYMFFGYPVVSTDFAQVRDLDDLVIVAKDSRAFIAALDEALREGKSEARKSFAIKNSWANKAKEILEFIND
jgi:glycosyltransferase involved in cell wall biosynthesis